MKFTKKKKLLSIVLILLIIPATSLQGIVYAQVPDYVGLEEGDEYIWKMSMESDGIQSIVDSLDALKDDIKADLGVYGNLNTSAAMKAIMTDSITDIGILPTGWEDKNVTTLFEDTIEYYVESMNATIQNIPSDWLSLNISAFLNYTIEGYGVENNNIFEVIGYAVNNITSSIGPSLPANWETYTYLDFIVWDVQNFLNDALFEGLVPNNWEDLGYYEFIAALSPGLDSGLIDFISYLTEAPFSDDTMEEMLIEVLNSTYIQTPGDMLTLTMKDLAEMLMLQMNNTIGSIPDDWDTIGISELANTILIGINDTNPPFDFLEEDLAFYINQTTYMINQSMYGTPTYGYTMAMYIDEYVDMQIQILDSSLSSIIPTWQSLTINQLIDNLYTSYVETNMALGILEMTNMGLFEDIRIKLVVGNISSEVVLSSMTYTPVNVSWWMDLGIGQFAPIPTSMMGEDFPLQAPLNIIDPTSMSDSTACLAEQGKNSMLLVIPKTYDTSLITWKKMTFDIPEPFDDIFFELVWNDNGILSTAELKHGTERVAHIDLVSSTEEEIPGYELSLIIGIGLLTLIGVFFITNKRRVKL